MKPTLSEAISNPAAGDYYEFRTNGEVIFRFKFEGNTVTHFWSATNDGYPSISMKPTLSEAVSNPASGEYFEFRTTGDVIHRFNYAGKVVTNFWSATDDTGPLPCKLCKRYDWELDADFVKQECSKSYCDERYIPCSSCGNDCNGGDYQKWNICSRSCL
jgi:hypothetical protein